jgi:NADH:ubiquinone oxidoreductase subunit F (NADH-binding)/NAD-dependent dihydropyrimidine dehydrogenase PreA subunit/(2Fe-2S) ferredoxin
MRVTKLEDLQRIKERIALDLSLRKGGYRAKINFHMGTCGIAAGAKKIHAQILRKMEEKGIQDIKLIRSGCAGLCSREPMITIESHDLPPVKYCDLNEEKIQEIFDRHIMNGELVESYALAIDNGGKALLPSFFENIPRLQDIPFFKHQILWALRNRGLIDAERIDEAIANEAYSGLAKVLTSMTPEEVIEEVKTSGLRGRGGAGFPTGLKWEEGRRYVSFPKYVICNGDEGDPGAFMDRSLLESDPHAVLEGMIICGYAIDSHQGYIYVRAEYPLAIHRLNIAIEQARNYGLLGKNILGSHFDFDIGIYPGAGAFVCGESTALMYSLEGKRGMPRIKPPRSTEAGLWGQPTVLNNVETFANIPAIIRNGGKWFASIGTKGSKGTKVFALVGSVKNVGLVEVPMGTTLRKIVYDIGGGISGDNEFKSIQIGGPSGACLPASLLDTEVDFDTLDEAGAMMGSGGLIVMNDSTCMVDTARFFTDFSVDESCGKCVPCRAGMKVMLNILDRIATGKGTMEDIEQLKQLGEHIKETSHCGLGKTAPNPVLSTIRYFRNEYEAHILEKRCPSLVCVDLIRFRVDTEKCKMCGLCKKACPAEAIVWEKKTPAVINLEKCIRCRSCIQACKFKAIE